MEITSELSLGKYFTFEPSKGRPIYDWFYYKEAFSPEIVEYVIHNYAKNAKSLFDPFCGAGTTVLCAKQHGINSFAVDSSPLAVFVSRAKCADYSERDIEEIKKFMEPREARHKTRDAESKTQHPPEAIDWQFELFPPSRAFPPSNLNQMLAIRSRLEALENENASNLLMLALLSIIPQTSLVVKDGGVLKIDKKKRAMPVKDAFKRKVKSMLADLGRTEARTRDPRHDIRLGDARKTEFENETADVIVTSPPYLNNIDYSKVYGLELSLLALDKRITATTRARSVRSFITSTAFDSLELPEEVREFADKIPIVGSYFSDMRSVLLEMHRILRPGGVVGFVVGNSVIHETHILVDEVIGEMAEKIGFDVEIVVGLERIADVRPAKVKTRESMIMMKKQ